MHTSCAFSLSVSDLINEVVRQSILGGAEDTAAFEERDREPLISFEEMVRRLREAGRL